MSGKSAIKRTRAHRRGARKQPAFLAVDFFCGAGGTTRGLIDADGYVIAGIDKDISCFETYTRNNPNTFIDSKSPRFLGYDMLPRTRRYPEGQQDQIFAELGKLIRDYKRIAKNLPLLFAVCAPCQPFTKLPQNTVGHQRRVAQKRDRILLLEAAKFIERFRPEFVLSENVPGINQRRRYGCVWEEFQQELIRLGYATGAGIVCASRFGVAQHRKRSILIAMRKKLIKSNSLVDFSGNLNLPEFDPNASPISVKQAIGGLPPIKAGEMHTTIPNHRARNLSPLNLRRLKAAKPGAPNSYMTNTRFGDLSLECHRKLNRRMKMKCFTDVYTRMHPDRPAPTITTKCHSISNGRFGHYDPRQIRGISLREAAKLQSFPAKYIFYPKHRVDSIAKMIGNAVPPKLARFYAKYLVNSAKL